MVNLTGYVIKKSCISTGQAFPGIVINCRYGLNSCRSRISHWKEGAPTPDAGTCQQKYVQKLKNWVLLGDTLAAPLGSANAKDERAIRKYEVK